MSKTEEPVETVNPDTPATDEAVHEGEVLVENEGIGSDTETLDLEDECDLDPDKMAAFCGTSREDIHEWLSHWRCTVVANRWNDEQELQMLPAFLNGAAGRWYDKQTDAIKNNSDDLKTAMQQKHLTNEMRNLSRTQLTNRSQQDGEDVQKFADEIEKMVGRGYAHLGNEARDEMAKISF